MARKVKIIKALRYGLEIEPKYCAVILERMAALGCGCNLSDTKRNGRK